MTQFIVDMFEEHVGCDDSCDCDCDCNCNCDCHGDGCYCITD